ncbi:hypothetical protein TNCV_2743381 [Trichonephila clavipes]|nr:hypothetical protein TNCV_2743381 [Trichonephila clavipes]
MLINPFTLGDKVQENIIPLMHHLDFHHQTFEKQLYYSACRNGGRYWTKDRNKELGSSSVQGVPSTGMLQAFQIYHGLQLKRLTRDEESTSSRQAIS